MKWVLLDRKNRVAQEFTTVTVGEAVTRATNKAQADMQPYVLAQLKKRFTPSRPTPSISVVEEDL